jgi:hypothetical protein
MSLAHLRWGLYRLYVDALLFFGNVRTAFRSLRDRQLDMLQYLFTQKRFDTKAIERRGPPLPLNLDQGLAQQSPDSTSLRG